MEDQKQLGLGLIITQFRFLMNTHPYFHSLDLIIWWGLKSFFPALIPSFFLWSSACEQEIHWTKKRLLGWVPQGQSWEGLSLYGLGTCWEPKDIGHDFAKYTCKWNVLKNNIMQFKWVWKLIGRSFL